MRTAVATTLIILGCMGPTPTPAPVDRAAEREKIAQVISSVIGWATDKKLDM